MWRFFGIRLAARRAQTRLVAAARDSRAFALVRAVGAVIAATARAFVADGAIRLAAAVAFYTALSLAPILVVVLSVAQFFWRDEEVRAELSRQIDELFGPQAADVVHAMLAATENAGEGAAALIAVGALLFGASLLFAQLQEALNEVWNVAPKPGRTVRRFLRKRLLSLVIVFGIGVLLLASLVVSAATSALIAHIDLLEWVEAARTWRSATIVATAAVATLLFAALFVLLPDARIAWRDVWLGAAITAVLFTAGQELIALYLAQAAVGSGYGAAGSLLAMLVWVYLSAIIFFLGAELTKVLALRYGRGIEPNEDAEWAPSARARADAEENARREA